MKDWNVVITARRGGYLRVLELMNEFGTVDHTNFLSVLVMKAEDPSSFLERFSKRVLGDPAVPGFIARVVPAEDIFEFHSADEFQTKARQASLRYLSQLSGKSFHVRIGRRGLKGKLVRQAEEKALSGYLLQVLGAQGARARINHKDPDMVVSVETVGKRAGISCWNREQLQQLSFLKF